MEQSDLTIRPITGLEELGLFSQLPYVLNEELADDLAAGRRRPEWMWVALRGDRLLARAAWWSRPGGDAPMANAFRRAGYSNFEREINMTWR